MNPSTTPVSDNLVPAVYGAEPTEITTTEVNRALSKQCSLEGYTGCHVWKITASTTQDIASANIRLNLNVAEVTDKQEWSYVVYTGTDSSSDVVLNKGLINTDFGDTPTTIDIHNGAALTAGTPAVYYVMVYLNNTNSVQNDGVTTGTTNETGTYNGSVILEAMGGEVKVSFIDTAAEYITNLYTNATKSTATVNNITYNLAPSVNLMNDRHASMSTGADAGDIRYYGANPNNYVWLGDSYIGGNWEVLGPAPFTTTEECLAAVQEEGITNDWVVSNTPYSTTTELCATGEQKKLWRVIGVFDGRVKLIQDVPIGDYSWDTSASTVNSGYGINQWGESGNYEGSDLMRLLNPGYESATVNNSLYWTKGTGTVYTAYNNATTADVSFANRGLTTAERNMIDTATWYTGAYDSFSYVDAHYNTERTSTWNGKVGLINVSDYGYAADLSQCNQTMDGYSNTGCTDWLMSTSGYWTMSPREDSGNASYVVRVFGGGILDSGSAAIGDAVRPAVYLKRGVTIDTEGKDGSESNPYVLNY